MPRKHKPIKHTRYTIALSEGGKTRYATERAAKEAAELRMLQNMSLELSVYQGSDGGWYLTSKPENQ